MRITFSIFVLFAAVSLGAQEFPSKPLRIVAE